MSSFITYKKVVPFLFYLKNGGDSQLILRLMYFDQIRTCLFLLLLLFVFEQGFPAFSSNNRILLENLRSIKNGSVPLKKSGEVVGLIFNFV